ncbi:MAG TPA: hypothetical protein VF193_09675, partial [Steroidobacter sp.]
MNDRGWNIAGTLAALALFFAVLFVVADKIDSARVKRWQVESQTAAERAAEGAYVESRARISDTETVTTLVVPSPYSELLDRRCLVYVNTAHGLSTMSCP